VDEKVQKLVECYKNAVVVPAKSPVDLIFMEDD
jgi:hypothetical protein